MKWTSRFIDLARTVSTWSKDPSTQVGAVVVRPDNTVASMGFNGFPRGMSDDERLYNDRDVKYSRIVHAEANAILNAHERLDGCSMYLTHPPCSACALLIIQSGIREVNSAYPSADLLSRWGESLRKTEAMFEEADVRIHYV